MDNQPLGKKLTKALKRIRDFSDNPTGMYRGDRKDMASAQYDKLIARGLAFEEQPHNPSHFYPYVVISDMGRKKLEQLEQTA